MYIEVSGKQSGKLTRLLKAALDHKGRSVVVTKTEAQAEALFLANPTLECVSESRFERYVEMRGGHGADRKHNVMYFFYDFDRFFHEVPLIKNGYYATTPTRLREADSPTKGDALLKLMNHAGRNNIPVHNFRNSDYGAQFKLEHKGCTNRDVIYQVQVLGRWHRKQLV